MARRKAGRSAGGSVVRSYDGKTRKVSVLLRPEDADRLRLAAVGLGVDQGDLVTAGLVEVLRGVEIRVRVLTPEASGEGQTMDGPLLRAVGS